MATGLSLLALAFFLLGAEAVIPSFGLLGVSGLAALVIGSSIVIENGGLPGLPFDYSIVAGLVALGALYLGLCGWVVARNLKKPAIAGLESLIGQHAEIVEWSDKTGLVHIQGELWQAVSERHHPDLIPGQKVRVGGHSDLKLKIHLTE